MLVVLFVPLLIVTILCTYSMTRMRPDRSFIPRHEFLLSPVKSGDSTTRPLGRLSLAQVIILVSWLA